MEAQVTYIAMDRRQALAKGKSLPERTTGAALFADISGFTPLTEMLLREYGSRRGPEEMTRQLNLIYDALVNEVHRYGGSVTAFSGDAITCWLDGDNGLRATACGLAMQQAISRFAAIETPSGQRVSLAMKAAVAIGPVRRFQVGDPQIQYIDTLAGRTLDQMATAEHNAEKGEVVVTAAVVAQAGDGLEIVEWREDHESGERFAVVAGLLDSQQEALEIESWPQIPSESLTEAMVRPWLLPDVFLRLEAGKGDFLTELRPAVAVFLSFDGIDFDDDEEAGAKLDAYIRWVQKILVRYEGYLFQLTIGDKGCYLYTAFGAPVAHEDDAIRAASAVLELQALPAELAFIGNVKIGVSQGMMRTGAYGGTARRTYGVMGDEVNLAARLMQAAEPGHILVSHAVQHAAPDSFTWEPVPPFMVKGKTEPVIAYNLGGLIQQQAIHLQEPSYALPMVGREAELTLIEEKMDEAIAGHGQIMAVIAEAGMGKSRLVAEVIRLATERHLVGYGGECQSYGTNISYMVWQPIWRSFFGIDPSWDLADQLIAIEMQLELIDPSLIQRTPLLSAVLNVSIPDNALTATFDAKLRKASLESLLVDCLRARAREAPLLLVLEDTHWLDPISKDLLEVIGRAISDLPVLIVMAYRPLPIEQLKEGGLEKLAYFNEIHLTDFTQQEAEQLISLKLEQFFGSHGAVPPLLLERITARAQGNPFYIEELLNYLQDQKFDPHDTKTLERLDLPASLHSLILSRIDRLTEQQKSIIKVASIIGRLFEADWLWGMYPELGRPEQIATDLKDLSRLDLVPMDKPEPELSYIFKHIVTREVAYESLPYAMRALLHDQFGQFIERSYRDRLDRHIDLLAYHYDRSENDDKKREYLRKAGELAQEEYANEAATDYYQRLLPILPPEERVEIMLNLGEVLQLVGKWAEAGDLYQKILTLTAELDDRLSRGRCQAALGELLRKQGQYAEASTWLQRAQASFLELNDRPGLAQILHYEGTLAAQQGDYETAQTRYEESLTIRRQLDDKPKIADLLSNLGLVAHYKGDYGVASKLYDESLNIRYRLADKRAIAISLNNLGYLAIEQGNYETARMQLEVALGLQREVGDRSLIADSLNNLGNVARDEGDYPTASELYKECLAINRDLGNKWGIAYLLEDIGGLSALQGEAIRALRLSGAGAALRKMINAPLHPPEQEKLDQMLLPAWQALGTEAAAAAVTAGRALSPEQAIEYALQGN